MHRPSCHFTLHRTRCLVLWHQHQDGPITGPRALNSRLSVPIPSERSDPAKKRSALFRPSSSSLESLLEAIATTVGGPIATVGGTELGIFETAPET